MAFKAALRAHLKAITPEVHWVVRPQNTPLPAIVLQTINETVERDMDGATGNASGRVQISCFANSHTAAETLKDDVLAAIEGSFTVGDTVITLQGEPDWFDRGTNTATGYVHNCLVEARFYHNG